MSFASYGRFRLLLAGLVLASAGAFAIAIASDPRDPPKAVDGSGGAPFLGSDEIAFEGVAFTGDGFSLSAGRVSRRTRTGLGGLLVYHSLKELVVSDVHLDVRVDSRIDRGVSRLLGNDVATLGVGSPLGAKGRRSTDQDEADLLTRVLLDRVRVDLRLRGARTLSLETEQARLDLESGALVFEAPVRIATPDGGRIEGWPAVWSDEPSGLYFEKGTVRDGVRRSGEAFFSIDPALGLVRAEPPAEIDASDFVQRQEAAVLEHLKEVAPPPLVAVLSTLQVVAAPTAVARLRADGEPLLGRAPTAAPPARPSRLGR